MIRKLRTRHRWLFLLTALIAGLVAVAAIATRRQPPIDPDAPRLGASPAALDVTDHA